MSNLPLVHQIGHESGTSEPNQGVGLVTYSPDSSMNRERQSIDALFPYSADVNPIDRGELPQSALELPWGRRRYPLLDRA
jgi:hypothetical protein